MSEPKQLLDKIGSLAACFEVRTCLELVQQQQQQPEFALYHHRDGKREKSLDFYYRISSPRLYFTNETRVSKEEEKSCSENRYCARQTERKKEKKGAFLPLRILRWSGRSSKKPTFSNLSLSKQDEKNSSFNNWRPFIKETAEKSDLGRSSVKLNSNMTVFISLYF